MIPCDTRWTLVQPEITSDYWWYRPWHPNSVTLTGSFPDFSLTISSKVTLHQFDNLPDYVCKGGSEWKLRRGRISVCGLCLTMGHTVWILCCHEWICWRWTCKYWWKYSLFSVVENIYNKMWMLISQLILPQPFMKTLAMIFRHCMLLGNIHPRKNRIFIIFMVLDFGDLS